VKSGNVGVIIRASRWPPLLRRQLETSSCRGRRQASSNRAIQQIGTGQFVLVPVQSRGRDSTVIFGNNRKTRHLHAVYN